MKRAGPDVTGSLWLTWYDSAEKKLVRAQDDLSYSTSIERDCEHHPHDARDAVTVEIPFAHR